MVRKLKLFEESTKHILDQVDKMKLPQEQSAQIKHFVTLFRSSFKLPDVKHAVFYPKIGDDYRHFPYASFAYCNPTSGLHVLLMGQDDWQLMYIDSLLEFGPHYFLMHKKSKTVLDYTYDQYTFDGIKDIPYYMGTPVKIDRNVKEMAKNFMLAINLVPEEIGLDSSNVIDAKEKNRRSIPKHHYTAR